MLFGGVISNTCYMCNKKLGFFQPKIPIPVAGGSRTVCINDLQRLRSTPVPSFTEKTCSCKNMTRFTVAWGIMLAVFIAAMTAIGLTLCAPTAVDDSGCVIAATMVGFFGGALCVISFPLGFWTLLHASVQKRRDRAALEQWERAQAADNEQRVAEDARMLRAMDKADAIAAAPFAVPSPVAPSAPPEHDADVPVVDANADHTCVVCMDAGRNAVFMPCTHLACCARCAKACTTCPICRQPVQNVVVVHVA